MAVRDSGAVGYACSKVKKNTALCLTMIGKVRKLLFCCANQSSKTNGLRQRLHGAGADGIHLCPKRKHPVSMLFVSIGDN